MIKDYEKYRTKENYVISKTTPAYDLEWRKGHLYPVIFKENKDLMKGRILYLGCNDGTSCYFLSQYCDELIGVDINKRALQKAEELFKEKGIINTRFVHANICSLPFEDNFFDGVYAFNILEHIFEEDQETVLREIKRVLKKGKCLLIEVPTPQNKYYEIPGKHVFFFESKEMIKKHFEKFFEIERIHREIRSNPGRPSEKHNSWMVRLKNV